MVAILGMNPVVPALNEVTIPLPDSETVILPEPFVIEIPEPPVTVDKIGGPPVLPMNICPFVGDSVEETRPEVPD